MTTVAADIFSGQPVVDQADQQRHFATDPALAGIERTHPEVLRKLRRVASGLARYAAQPERRAIAVLEVDSAEHSSLWMTRGLAAALGTMLKEPVAVLAVKSGRAAEESPRRSEDTADALPSVEFLIPASEGCAMPVAERLEQLQASGRTVLLHLSHDAAWNIVSLDEGCCAGVVLITRASRTRKAAVERLQERLRQLAMPVLGAVLLGHKESVPERLYRLL